MKIAQNENWLSAYVQACNKPLSILIIKVELEEERASNKIKVNMRRNPALAMSDTHNINM